MVTTEQIKALEERQTALHTHLHIDDRRLELDEQESLTHAPDFWDDPGKAEEQLKKVAGIKYWITAYDAIASAMEELHLLPEFIREGVSAPEELDAQYGRVLEMIEPPTSTARHTGPSAWSPPSNPSSPTASCCWVTCSTTARATTCRVTTPPSV